LIRTDTVLPLAGPVDVVERLDRVLARLHLLGRGHGVLEVEEHHVASLSAAFSIIVGFEAGTASSER
jgi:hypothetical protein